MCVTLYNVRHNALFGVQNAGKKSVFAPCGKCVDCRTSHQYAWAWRLASDLQYYVKERGYKVGFITLTYNESSLPRIPDGYGDASGMSCFSKYDTNQLILYLRKTLWRDYDCKEFLYFLASERGPNGTHRPHYHLLIAWNPANGLSAEVMHQRISRYWSKDLHFKLREPWGAVDKVRPALGYVTPATPQGGERKRDGKKILPFEVQTMDKLLKSAFYTAKYVTKDIYFMRDIADKVSKETLKSPTFKNWLPHHRQSKSLGFHSVASLSDAQKISLLLLGKNLLGSDKLSMPPLYIQNKLLYRPCYLLGAPCKQYPNGKRYSLREATEFYQNYFDLIFANKVKYYDTLFDSMRDVQFWLSSGLDEHRALQAASYVRFNDYKSLFGCSMAEAYLTYYGMAYKYSFVDKKLTILNRFRHPALTFSSVLIDRVKWYNIQEFFGYLMSFCRWQNESTYDEMADVVRCYWNQLA